MRDSKTFLFGSWPRNWRRICFVGRAKPSSVEKATWRISFSAALSISNNIAEGFERGTTNELITFLYYARGSAGEVRSMLCVMDLMPEYDHFKSQISDFKSRAESISRQIRGWTNNLQNTDIAGQRHLNDQSRRNYEGKKKRDAFWDEQRQFMARKEAQLIEESQRRRDTEGNRDSDQES